MITSKLWHARETASVDDLLVLLRPRPKHLDQLVDGSGGDESADNPPPLLWTLCSFTVLQSHPHNLHLGMLPFFLAVIGQDRLHQSPNTQDRPFRIVKRSNYVK